MADIDWIETPAGRKRRPLPEAAPGPGWFYFPDRPGLPVSGNAKWNDQPRRRTAGQTLRQTLYLRELVRRSDGLYWATLGQRLDQIDLSNLNTLLLEVIADCGLILGAASLIGGVLGATAGLISGGMGTVPGAVLGSASGAELGLWYLNVLGLAAVAEYLLDGLPAAIAKLQQGIMMAWEAGAFADPADEFTEVVELRQAAIVFAEGRLLLTEAIIAGILAAFALKGAGSVVAAIPEGTSGFKLVNWVEAHRDYLRQRFPWQVSAKIEPEPSFRSGIDLAGEEARYFQAEDATPPDEHTDAKLQVLRKRRLPDLQSARSSQQARDEFRALIGTKRYAKYASDIEELKWYDGDIRHIATEDLVAIRGYTAMDYVSLNSALRTNDAKQLAHLRSYIECLNSGLEQLPSYHGTVFRGTQLGRTERLKYKPGMIIDEPAFTSTSSDIDNAFEGNTQFVIDSLNGKDVSTLSTYPGESEVLFRSGTAFKVLAVTTDKANKETEIYLREIERDLIP